MIIRSEIVFERLGLGSFNIEPQAKLTLYCEGLESRIILDSGKGVHIVFLYILVIYYIIKLKDQILEEDI